MLVKTSDLTPGEKLVLLRRRDGLSQVKAAKKAKVSLFAYRQWERDEVKPPRISALGRIADHEQCFILRRRAEMTAEELADVLGVCRWWLCQMERGQVDTTTLVEHWQAAA